jgi:hypothetical protein
VASTNKFRHGGVEYPLTASTANELLEDADPAVHFALELFSSAIKTYAGDRLLAQAAREGLNFPSAVEKTIHVEPTPFLLSDQLVFPILCLYRSDDDWGHLTVAHDKCASTWEWAYVLPPLTPRQIEQLQPILRSVSVIVSTFAMQSFDPQYDATRTLRDLSGIMRMRAGPAKYGEFEPVDGDNKRWWRAIVGKLLVEERTDLVVPSALEPFEGFDLTADLVKPDGEVLEAFLQESSGLAPSISSVSPASGSKAGGTLVTITGKNFRPLGVRPQVIIGGALASSVVVTHPTTLQCLTPPHDATPTFVADVQVVAGDDGQASNVLEGAFTFTTP